MSRSRDEFDSELEDDDQDGGLGLSLDKPLGKEAPKEEALKSEPVQEATGKEETDAESSRPKVLIDPNELTPEERIKRRKEEREKLEAELKIKLAERKKREEEEAKRKKEEEEERLRDIEAEKKRLAALEVQKKIDEAKQKKAEEAAKKRKEQEEFYAKMGLTPEGKPLEEAPPSNLEKKPEPEPKVEDEDEDEDEDEVFMQQLEKAEKERLKRQEQHEQQGQQDHEEDATRRMALDDLEFQLEEEHEEKAEAEVPLAEFRPQSLPIAPSASPVTEEFPYSDKCSFCKIHKKILKAMLVYQNSLLMVFLDPRPIHRGQLIITPRGHYSSIEECPEEVALALMKAARLVTSKLKKASIQSPAVSFYLSESIDIDVSERHLYMSAIPRRPADGVTIRFGAKDNVSRDEMKVIGMELKKVFNADS
jgi:diadenosine tetraphosphate (Ap4A) HIT family hydrolase